MAQEYPKVLYRKDAQGVIRHLTVGSKAEEDEFVKLHGFGRTIAATGSQTAPAGGRPPALVPITHQAVREEMFGKPKGK